MSYSRHFSKTITIEYSGTVHYPASEHGGSVNYSGSASERIDFNVHVDTDPFDNSIDNVNDGVNLLTGSIAATEVAQVESIKENSKKIGQTIIAGFFKTVKSDISQQITALKVKIEAKQVQLYEYMKRCRSLQDKMTVDYNRLSSRYGKIFDDLNKELDNRIHAIDEPVFRLSKTTDEVASGPEQLIPTVTVTADENARAYTKITASRAKRQAVETIRKAQDFLGVQYATDRLLDSCLRQGGDQQKLMSPFCVVETTAGPSITDEQVIASPLLQNLPKETLVGKLPRKCFNAPLSANNAEMIAYYFNSEMAKVSQSAVSPHDQRVAQMTANLFNLSQTATPHI